MDKLFFDIVVSHHQEKLFMIKKGNAEYHSALPLIDNDASMAFSHHFQEQTIIE